MELVITPGGQIRAIYSEELELAALGHPTIVRASTVEPNHQNRWSADLGPLNGPVLGPFAHRSEALTAEVAWLEKHWLAPGG